MTQLAAAGLAMQNRGLNTNESCCLGLQGLSLRGKNTKTLNLSVMLTCRYAKDADFQNERPGDTLTKHIRSFRMESIADVRLLFISSSFGFFSIWCDLWP